MLPFRELLTLVQRFYARSLAAFAVNDERGFIQPGEHHLKKAGTMRGGHSVMQAVFPKPGSPIR